MVVLSWGGALVFHTLLPRYYFAWYPSIPIFLSFRPLLHIYVRMLLSGKSAKMVAVYLVAKVTKMMLSILIMSVYAVAVAHQVLSFIGTYMVFYIIFLILKPASFFHFEIKHKSNRYKYK